MRSPSPRPTYQPYSPAWADDCPCGSGKSFGACCRTRLPGFEIGKAFRPEAEAGRWGAALLQVRADVCQYVIWHRDHTRPGFFRGPMPVPSGRDLLSIDIEALSEYVSRLCDIQLRAGRGADLPGVLRRLEDRIDDPRWRRKMLFHRSMATLLLGDRPGALVLLDALGPVGSDETDVELIQLYIDLHRRDLGFTERQALYARILAQTVSRSDRLQYGGAKAFDLLLVGDQAGGHAAMAAVVAQGREMEAEKPLSPGTEVWFCQALEALATLERDDALFAELVRRLNHLLTLDTWTTVGRAQLLRHLGDAHRHRDAWMEGAAAYQASWEVSPLEIVRVFAAECLLRDGDSKGSLALIQSLKADHFDAPEAADHAFTYALAAVAAGDLGAVRSADQLLRAVKTEAPYFESLRLGYLVKVQEALHALEAGEPRVDLGPMLRGLSALSRYTELKPNWMGVGLNFNNMIDDFVARAATSASAKPRRSKPAKGKSGARQR